MEENKRTKYIYGVSPHQFARLPYEDALKFKIGAGKALMKKISINKDDEARYVAAEKAVRFNERLLEELSSS